MGHVNFTDFRANMAAHLDRIEQDRTELVLTRQNHQPMVIVPLADWERMLETLHILGSPEHTRRLLDDAAELDGGKGEAHDLISS